MKSKKRLLILMLMLSLLSAKIYGQAPDVGIVEILHPNTDDSCFYSDATIIQVVIQNYDTANSAFGFPVAFQRFGDSTIQENYLDTIQKNGKDTFQFAATVDLRRPINMSITAWTDWALDLNATNDTLVRDYHCVCYDSTGTPYVCNQINVRYVDDISFFAKDSLRQEIIDSGGILLDTFACGDRHLDRYALPYSFPWDDTLLIGTEGQGECLRKRTVRVKEAELNWYLEGDSYWVKRDNTKKKNKPDRRYKQPSRVKRPKSKRKVVKLQQTNTDHDTIKIVIIDTGVDFDKINDENIADHRHCLPCRSLDNFIDGFDFVNFDTDASDDNGDPYNPLTPLGHGSLVAKVMTDYASSIGFSNYKITSLKALDHAGGGMMWDIALSTITAEALGADIINGSFGWRGQPSDLMHGLLKELGDSSCHGLFVFSAGNETENNDDTLHQPSDETRRLSNVMSIAATDATGGLAGYSNFGVLSVDGAAPGDIYNDNGVIIKYGTSFAAPYVSIRYAFKLFQNEHISATQFKMCFNQISKLIVNGGDTLINHVLDSITTDTLYDCLNNLTVNTSCKFKVCVVDTLAGINPPIFPPEIDVKAFPNPFNHRMIFQVEIEEPTDLELFVFDLTGRLVFYQKEKAFFNPTRIEWDGINRGILLSSGTYFYYVKTEKGIGRGKIVKINY